MQSVLLFLAFLALISLVSTSVYLRLKFRKEVEEMTFKISAACASFADCVPLYANGREYVSIRFTYPDNFPNDPQTAFIGWDENNEPSLRIKAVVRAAARKASRDCVEITVQRDPIL